MIIIRILSIFVLLFTVSQTTDYIGDSWSSSSSSDYEEESDFDYENRLDPANARDRVDTMISYFNELKMSNKTENERNQRIRKFEKYYEIVEAVDKETYEVYPEEYERIQKQMQILNKEKANIDFFKYKEFTSIKKNEKSTKKRKKIISAHNTSDLDTQIESYNELGYKLIKNSNYTDAENKLVVHLLRDRDEKPIINKNIDLARPLASRMIFRGNRQAALDRAIEYNRRIDFLKERKEKMREIANKYDNNTRDKSIDFNEKDHIMHRKKFFRLNIQMEKMIETMVMYNLGFQYRYSDKLFDEIKCIYKCSTPLNIPIKSPFANIPLTSVSSVPKKTPSNKFHVRSKMSFKLHNYIRHNKVANSALDFRKKMNFKKKRNILLGAVLGTMIKATGTSI